MHVRLGEESEKVLRPEALEVTGLEPPNGSDDDVMMALAPLLAILLALTPWFLAWLIRVT